MCAAVQIPVVVKEAKAALEAGLAVVVGLQVNNQPTIWRRCAAGWGSIFWAGWGLTSPASQPVTC